jgi:hypothetical protein
MKIRSIAIGVATALLAAGNTLAATPDVRIPFANYGGINDWRADGVSAIYIQGRNRRWYRAELMGSCIDLPFAEHVGFVVEPSGEFDRFSEIIVHGHRCVLKSLVESAAPPAKAKGKAIPATPAPGTAR